MARKSRGRNQRSTLWTYISFIIFAIIIALLGTSLYKKESPAQVLRSLIPKSKEKTSLQALSKKELLQMAMSQDSTINALTDKLNQYSYDYELSIGMIDVDASTLNLRKDPTTDAEVILRLPDNSQVIVLYYGNDTDIIEGESGKWCKIKYGNTEGWVWGNYVKIID